MKVQLERPCTFTGVRSWDSDRDDVTITLGSWVTVVDNLGSYAYSYPANLVTGVVYSNPEASRMVLKKSKKS